MLNFYATEIPSGPDSHSECQDGFQTKQPCVSLQKVSPNLEVLSLGKEEVKMIEQGKLHVDLQELNSLILQCFHDESDLFPFVFCSKAPLPSMKKLVMRHSAFKEIFPFQTSDIDCTKILSQLKEMELRSLSLLKSIGLGHSWMWPFLENLETLLVLNCGGLTNLTPSTVSFSNLIKLHVKNCRGLKYLFTSATAKTLCMLKKLYIDNCMSLKAIVAKEGDEYQYDNEDEDEAEGRDEDERECESESESEDEIERECESEAEDDDDDDDDNEDENEGKDYDEGQEYQSDNEDEDESEFQVEDENKNEGGIIFKQLELLKLSSSPKLRSFYLGSSILKFPSLEHVSFAQCYNKKIFRLGDEVPKDLQVTIDGDCPDGDINSVIMQQSEERQPADLVS